MNRLALLLLLSVSAFAQRDDADRWNKATYITIDSIPKVILAKAKPAAATVRFRVKPGFHVNSNKPSSDLLIPTEIKFESQPLIAVGKLSYPTGEQLALSFSPKQKLSVYQGDISVNVPLSAARKAKPGVYTLKGLLSYQACNDNACFPPKTAAFELPVDIR